MVAVMRSMGSMVSVTIAWVVVSFPSGSFSFFTWIP